MNSKIEGIRLPQVKSFCIVFPDSCILLHYIFNEEEFRPKIEHFQTMAKGIPCEILPRVNLEIVKKLIVASNEYIRTVRRCKSLSQKIINNSLDKVFVSKEMAEVLEKVFVRVFDDIARNHLTKYKVKIARTRRVRIIETSVMLEFWGVIERSEKITLNAFFDKLEDTFSAKYTEFCDKQSLFMRILNATPLKDEDLLETTDDLRDMLIKSVHNPKDIDVLREAIGRMYKTNKWCAVVTTDYGDIIRNRFVIEKLTQLIVSDPLYFVYHLDKKIDWALTPKDGATKMKIQYSSIIKPTKPPFGVV